MICSPKAFLDSLVIEAIEHYKSVWPEGLEMYIRNSYIQDWLVAEGYSFSLLRVRASIKRVAALGIIEKDLDRSYVNSYCWRVI